MDTATKVGHTPGPWHSRTIALIRFDGDLKHLEECHELANINTDETVCYVPIAADAVSCPNGEANANLIAAAPDLLAVCKQVDEVGRESGSVDTGVDIDWNMLRAAIARAEGR